MNRICYKICLKLGKNTFVSAMGRELKGDFLLRYEINQKTTAKIGRLFVFDSLNNAVSFLSRLSYIGFVDERVVFEGFAKNVGTPKYLSSEYMSARELNYYWNRKKAHKTTYYGKKAPKGTLTCESFTPYVVVHSRIMSESGTYER